MEIYLIQQDRHQVLFSFSKGLLKLKGAGIPMYAIAGNHDIVNRNGAIPPQVLFKNLV